MIFRRREHLLDVCIDLIQRHGFQGTGINAIVNASRIQKSTIYKHYKSKDRLLAEALKRHSGLWREWFFSEVEERAKRPYDRVTTVFTVLEDWIDSPGFRGCIFLHALAEFPKKAHPVNKAAIRHKKAVHDALKNIAQEIPAKRGKKRDIENDLILLYEGVIATAHVTGDAAAAALALSLLKQRL
jgi:AcrR family transcriptional regulator